jgi:hypothetical protein
VIAVHVADPQNFRHIGLDFLKQHESGGRSPAIEEKACFLRLNENAGVLATCTGMTIGRAEENGAHPVTLLSFTA